MKVHAHFDGETYDPKRDKKRLTNQLGSVYSIMKMGRWTTLEQLGILTGFGSASVSARLRDLRKRKFGGYTIYRRYVRNGIWEYRMFK